MYECYAGYREAGKEVREKSPEEGRKKTEKETECRRTEAEIEGKEEKI